MKIKILKKKNALMERWQMSSQSSMKYILEDLFNPASKNNVFDKKLIFYDLETNGFGQAAYVHQIAALEFDLGGIFRKYIDGNSVSDDIKSLKATGGIIVKALFDEKDFVEKDEKTRIKRNKFYDINFKFLGKKDPIPFQLGKELMRGSNGIRFDYDPKNKEPETIIGCSLCLTDAAWMQNSSLISDVLVGLEGIKSVEIDVVTGAIIKYCLEEVPSSTPENTSPTYRIRRPWKSNAKIPEGDLKQFFSKLYELFYTLSNSPYTFTKKRGGPKKQALTTNLKRTWAWKKNGPFAFTYTENKNFTEYEKFPLERYREGYGYDEEEKRPSEKHGIIKFLKYLKGLGKNKYILIGHNIKAFDNSVILQRSEKHKIPKNLVKNFQDSQGIDSLNLLNMYTKQMSWFSKNAETLLGDIASTSKTRDVSIESLRKVKEITKMHKKVKSKLDGMLRVFSETENKKQTHTADDDCEDLARVLSLAVIDMLSMAKAYDDIKTQPLIPQDLGELPKYEPENKTASKIAPTIRTKFKNDLKQLGIIDLDWAKNSFKKSTDKDAIDRVSVLFSNWLAGKTAATYKDLTSEEVMHKSLAFKTYTDTKRSYNEWLETLQSEEVENSNSQLSLDFGLEERVCNKWKKLIK